MISTASVVRVLPLFDVRAEHVRRAEPVAASAATPAATAPACTGARPSLWARCSRRHDVARAATAAAPALGRDEDRLRHFRRRGKMLNRSAASAASGRAVRSRRQASRLGANRAAVLGD